MLKNVKKLIIFISLVIAIFAVANFALAADVWGNDPNGANFSAVTGLGGTDIRVTIAQIIRLVIGFLGIIAVCLIIYAGFIWMTAAGEPQKIEKAKKILSGALIGLVLILASFAIVSFILNSLSTVTSGGGDGSVCTPACSDPLPYCCSSSCQAGACGSIIPPVPNTFIVASTIPSEGAVNVIRNVVIRYNFNQSVDSATVNASTFTVVDSSNAPINGDRNVVGNRIAFSPLPGTCPANACGADRCLPANEQITVTAAAGSITSVGGLDLICPSEILDPNSKCVTTFTTNDAIDCSKPTLNILDNGQVCLDSDNLLGFTSTDDSGVSSVEFNDSNGGNAFLNGPAPIRRDCLGPDCTTFNETDSVNWHPTVAQGYNPSTNYIITARAEDYDSNTVSDSVTYNLRPAHCCSGTKNGDETGIDCGGSCGACDGAACATDIQQPTACEDNLCASQLCTKDNSSPSLCVAAGYVAGTTECCLCQRPPVITGIFPVGGFCDGSPNTPCLVNGDCTVAPNTCNKAIPNGAVGNFVTIIGKNFGTTPGMVKFFNNQTAQLASAANAQCANSWQDNQIIAVVPAGAVNGPISVETASGFSDDTTLNPALPPFLINTIFRPGLCQLTPAQGAMNTAIDYYGIRLNGADAYFGDSQNNVSAFNSLFATDTQGSAGVPNIQTGRTTSFVINNNIFSNYLGFTKQPEPYIGPFISSFDPLEGSAGQYVTIRGQGFGASKGTSKVYFDTTEASYDFPQICADSIWSDKQVIVKVPAGLVNGNYSIVMNIGTWPPINTDSLNPATFAYNSTSDLTPGLCKINPIMGQVNSQVSLWGEYFGMPKDNVNSKVRFYLNHDQSGIDITYWDQDNTALGNVKPDKAVTTVDPSAGTGPVRVLNAAGKISNGLNFAVGICKTDSECGGGTNFCCPNGTPFVGRCKTGASVQLACFPEYQSSVYEWDFSTSGIGSPCYNGAQNGFCDISQSNCVAPLTCNPNTCLCEADNTCTAPTPDKCDNSVCCSAGGCKNFDGIPGTECSDGLESCSGYNQCLDTYFCPNSPGQCSPYAGGTIVTGDCNNNSCENFQKCQGGLCEYQPAPVNRCVPLADSSCDLSRAIDYNLGPAAFKGTASCLPYESQNRWIMTVNTSCPTSPTSWTNIGGNRCVEDNTVCDICATGFKCLANGPNGICAIDQAVCPAGSTCTAGECIKIDAASCDCCCRKSQSAQDCCVTLNCEGSCGSGGADFGLCTGCTIKNFDNSINQADSNQACNCLGTSGKYCDTGAASGRGVCKDCAQLPTASSCTNLGAGVCCVDAKKGNACLGGTDTVNSSIPGDTNNYCSYYPCDNSTGTCGAAVASSSLPVYKTSDCDEKCTKAPAFGQSCAKVMPEPITQCDYSICSGFSCLTDSGTIPTTPPCGTCCCDPSANPDQCKAKNSILTCKADQSPCTGASRGLCCDCTDDLSCGSSSTTGCGQDACCHARPSVIHTQPSGTNVCRNAVIQATFDQTMDIGAFSGNVIVFGDYGASPCPAGTQYLTAAYKPTFLARVKSLLAKIPLIRKLIASDAKAITGNFCAIKGAVGGYNYNAANTGVLEFRPDKVLDADTKYYVFVKGDSNTGDAIKQGVLSVSGVGMAPVSFSPDSRFNGITYNGYIWYFTTMPDSGADNGICRIAYATIEPDSYLFTTNQNDPDILEDTPTNSKFDTIKDSDKLFIANAYAEDGTALNPIVGVYNWDWAWTSGNTNLFDTNVVDPLVNKINVVRTKPNVTEGKSFINAQANVNGLMATPGESYIAQANVYLMVCNNPWPVIKADGSWEPWSDKPANYSCTPNSGTCNDYNFEIYYCRDQNSSGTADDLPAILNDAVARGYSPEIFKELYFFREGLPATSSALTVTALSPGNSARASWIAVPGATGYKLYYGAASGKYTQSIKKVGVNNRFETVNNLTNKKTYYFAVTSYNALGAESAYSNEVSVLIDITQAPGVPNILWALPLASSTAQIAWLPNADKATAGYKVYYGVQSGYLGGWVSLEKSKCGLSRCLATIDNLTPGKTYYFAVSALDAAGKESAKSIEVSTTLTTAINRRLADLIKISQALYLYADNHDGKFPVHYSAPPARGACLGIDEIDEPNRCWMGYQSFSDAPGGAIFGLPGYTALNQALAPYIDEIPLDPLYPRSVGDAYVYFQGMVGIDCGFGPYENGTWIAWQPDTPGPEGSGPCLPAASRRACCSRLGIPCGYNPYGYYCVFKVN